MSTDPSHPGGSTAPPGFDPTASSPGVTDGVPAFADLADPTSLARTGPPRSDAATQYRTRLALQRARCVALERELAARESRLRAVRERYETVLEGRERGESTPAPDERSGGLLARLRDLF